MLRMMLCGEGLFAFVDRQRQTRIAAESRLGDRDQTRQPILNISSYELFDFRALVV